MTDPPKSNRVFRLAGCGAGWALLLVAVSAESSIERPSTATRPAPRLVLVITARGELVLPNRPRPLASMAQRRAYFRSLPRPDRPEGVILQAHKDTDYAQVYEVIRDAQAAGFTCFHLRYPGEKNFSPAGESRRQPGRQGGAATVILRATQGKAGGALSRINFLSATVLASFVSPDELQQCLRLDVADTKVLEIAADSDLKFRHLIVVTEACRKAGIAVIEFLPPADRDNTH
jgi:biopolymer transport protein ExbD